MRRTRLALVLALMTAPLAHADTPAPAATAPQPADAWQWLEDVEAPRSLDWVRAQNADSQKVLEGQPGFGALRDDLLAILDSNARIPFVGKQGE